MVAVTVELVDVRCRCGKLLGCYGYGAVRFYCSKCGEWTERDAGRVLTAATRPAPPTPAATSGPNRLIRTPYQR